MKEIPTRASIHHITHAFVIFFTHLLIISSPYKPSTHQNVSIQNNNILPSSSDEPKWKGPNVMDKSATGVLA